MAKRTGSDGDMASRMRQLLDGPDMIRAVNVYDPLTARIAEHVGFQAIGLGGFALGTHRCVTEPTLTMTETIAAAQLITRAVRIPLKVDCGAGFGEPMHVVRTVREAEAAGIACIHIEDQHYPKRAHYHRGIEHVIDAEQMIEKITAALSARQNPDFVLIGRTDTARTHGIKEAIRRGNLYAEKGCDMIEAFPNTREEAQLAAREIKAPLLFVNSPGNRHGRPVLSWAELQDMGFKMVLDAPLVILSAAKAVRQALQHYMDHGRPPAEIVGDPNIREWVESVSGLPELYAIEERTTERLRTDRMQR